MQDFSLMNTREFFFNVMNALPACEQAALLLPAFEHALERERTPLATMLARTGRPEAVKALVRRWDQIDPTHRPTVARQPDAPLPAIESLALDNDAHVLRGMLAFICDRGDARLMPALLPLLEAETAEVEGSDNEPFPRRAAAALLQVTVAQLGPRGRGVIDSAAFEALDDALGRSLEGYRSHRCEDVLLAVAIVADRAGPTLRAILDQSDHPGTVALRGVPQRIEDELVRANLIRWLGIPIMQRPALRHLEAIRTIGQWNHILAAGHLLLSPARRRMVRRHPAPRRLLPTIAHAVQLNGTAQSNLIDWERSCGLTTPQRIAYLRDLIALTAPLARMKVVRRLGVLADAGVADANDALRAFANDGNAHVARIARRTQRQTALDRQRAGDAETLQKDWDKLGMQQRLAVMARLATVDPAAVTLILRTAITSTDRRRSLPGLALTERLGLARQMRKEIAGLLQADDAHVTATAVSVLGRAVPRRGDRQLVQQLRAMLDHPDARVRANAIESLAGLRRRADTPPTIDAPEIAPLLDAEDNRLRANAVRALLDHTSDEAAGATWRAMARDARPLHRISAIWVAARTPRSVMRRELRRLTSVQNEPIPEVRTRAGAALRWVEGKRMEASGAS